MTSKIRALNSHARKGTQTGWGVSVKSADPAELVVLADIDWCNSRVVATAHFGIYKRGRPDPHLPQRNLPDVHSAAVFELRASLQDQIRDPNVWVETTSVAAGRAPGRPGWFYWGIPMPGVCRVAPRGPSPPRE